jgi:hypothetical protein
MKLMTVKLQTSPSLILVASRAEESLVKALEPSSADDYTISTRPVVEFSFDRAKQKILKLAEVLPYANRISLEIPDDTLGGDGERMIKMGGVIEWHKQISVCHCPNFAEYRLDVLEH